MFKTSLTHVSEAAQLKAKSANVNSLQLHLKIKTTIMHSSYHKTDSIVGGILVVMLSAQQKVIEGRGIFQDHSIFIVS